MQTFDIFDEIEKEEDIFDTVSEKDFEEFTEPSALKEVPQFAVKGVAKGLGTPGSILELVGLQAKEQLPGEKIRIEREAREPADRPSFASMLGEDDLLPPSSRLPTAEEAGRFAELLGLPEQPRTAAGRFAERAGEAAGAAATFGGAGIIPLVGSALAGQAVEEVTGSPLAGTITELAAPFAPWSVAKRLAPGKKTKDLVEAGRKLGLTEQQITPLIQQEGKIKAIAKFARKGDKTEKLIFGIESALGDSYGALKTRGANLPFVKFDDKRNMISSFLRVGDDLKKTVLPSPEKQQAIKYINDAVNKMRSKNIDPEQLINFYQDLNQFVNWGSIKNGKKSLAALKKPVLKAINSVDPELGKDFESLNKLYGKFKVAQKALKPTDIDKWLNFGEKGAFILSLASRHPSFLKHLFVERAGRSVAKQLITNPRFQGMQKKLLNAVKKDNMKNAAIIGNQMIKLFKKEFPDEVREDLSGFDFS